MAYREKYDVIVVGAGQAALTAAISARNEGASVVVLEKAPQASRRGNLRFIVGDIGSGTKALKKYRTCCPGLSEAEA